MSFEEYFDKNLPKVNSFHPYFNEALSWILQAGGKHFRAKLLLGVLQTFCDDEKTIQNAYPVACAIEFLHTYSLIHDDLPTMDNADLRRGVETLHKKYDETTAVLVGDALNTQAFYMISKSNLQADILIKCVEILSTNGGLYGMIIGQALDCYFEKTKLELENLKFLHLHKTGALIAASMQMGAVIAGLSQKECQDIYDIGLDLGLAFQVHDDILDTTSTAKDLGKPINNDGDKNSFVNLLGLEEAIKFRDKLEEEIISKLAQSPLKRLINELIEKYLRG